MQTNIYARVTPTELFSKLSCILNTTILRNIHLSVRLYTYWFPPIHQVHLWSWNVRCIALTHWVPGILILTTSERENLSHQWGLRDIYTMPPHSIVFGSNKSVCRFTLNGSTCRLSGKLPGMPGDTGTIVYLVHWNKWIGKILLGSSWKQTCFSWTIIRFYVELFME